MLEGHGLYPANRNGAGQVVAAGAADALTKLTAEPPARVLLSNLDGSAVATGRELLHRLVHQVTAPVRWDLCMRTLKDLGVTGVIELPPAGTLAGLIKRELKGDGAPEIVTLNTPDDLPAARDLVARHGVAPSAEPTPQFRVVVAGTAGYFSPAPGLDEGTEVRSGQAIGHIETKQGPVEVTAHDSGVLTEWLAHNDDPVAPGQPLARIGGHLA